MKKLLSMFLALGLCVSLVGCSSGEAAPQDTVSAMIDTYKAQKLDELSNYYEGGDDFFEDGSDLNTELEAAEEELMNMFMEKLTDVDYTIENETIDEDTATVTVKITANNVGEKLAEGLQQAIVTALGLAFSETPEEEVNAIVAETMISPVENCEKTYENTVEVKLVKSEDGAWLLVSGDENYDLANALTGGLMQFSDELDNMSTETVE